MCFQHVVGGEKNSNALIARFPGFDFFSHWKSLSLLWTFQRQTHFRHSFCSFHLICMGKVSDVTLIPFMGWKWNKKKLLIYLLLCRLQVEISVLNFFSLQISRIEPYGKYLANNIYRVNHFYFTSKQFSFPFCFFLNSRLNWMNLFFLSTVKVII